MFGIMSDTKVEGTGYIVFGGGVVSIANNCWHFVSKMAATCLLALLDAISKLFVFAYFQISYTYHFYQSLAQIRIWLFHSWIQRRRQYGAYHSLIKERASEDPHGFKKFLRMDENDFEEQLAKVSPYIKRQDTCMRESIDRYKSVKKKILPKNKVGNNIYRNNHINPV